MPSYLDLALIAVVLISALLSKLRGFTREILAIASWAAAAVAAYYYYPLGVPYILPYVGGGQQIAMGVSAAIILDSKVGALDRSMGFLFGAARGLLLGVVAFLFFNWLVPEKSQPEWVHTAKTKPLLTATGEQLMAFLPDDPESALLQRLKRNKGGEETPAEPEKPSSGGSARPTPDRRP